MTHVFRSTRVVTPDRVGPATVTVEGERIVAIGEWDALPTDAKYRDLGNLIVLPGLVDTHVHINDPGRTDWERFATATKAAAAGGVTLLVDMPLNCYPEITSVPALEKKRAAARGEAWVDWAAWGGVVRGNADSIKPLIEAGVPGFKCFLIQSGIDGFPWVNESDLRPALKKLRGSGLPLLAHAEVPEPVDAATAALNQAGSDWRRYSTYLASRPDEAEIEAIALLIRLAEEFHTPVHIVHLASAKALPIIDAAKGRGVPITVETCAHYLWFAAEEIPDGATEYKCAPPLRSAANREQLWNALTTGIIDMVTTDHSPCAPSMKQCADGKWNEAWGGIASLGLTLPVMWTGMRRRHLNDAGGAGRIAEWLAAAPARLAGCSAEKGSLRVGADADFVVFDPDAEWRVEEHDLHFLHKLSPYIGARFQGRIVETWLRGQRIYGEQTFSASSRGREWVRR